LTFFLLWAPIFGLSVGAYQTTLQTSVERATQPAMMGRVSGLLTLGSVGTTPIGGVIVGWLVDAWSPRAGMGLGALACLIGGIGLLLSQRRGRMQSPPPPPSTDGPDEPGQLGSSPSLDSGITACWRAAAGTSVSASNPR
jgi:MFS family permease